MTTTTGAIQEFSQLKKLPQELQNNVLSFFKWNDFPELARVCKNFYNQIYNCDTLIPGKNYREFLSRYFTEVSMKTLSEAYFVTLIPSEYSDEIKKNLFAELWGIIKPKYSHVIESRNQFQRDALTDQELCRLIKQHHDPILQSAEEKLKKISFKIAPLIQSIDKNLKKDKSTILKIKKAAEQAKKTHEEEQKKTSSQHSGENSALMDELLKKTTRVKPAAKNQPAAPIGPPPATVSPTTSKYPNCRIFLSIVIPVAAIGYYFFR